MFNFADYLSFIQGAFVVVMFVYLISNFDDLVIDLMYLRRVIYRTIFVYSRHRRMRIEDLKEPTEQPIALMFPAWQESAVLFRSLTNLFSTLDYSNFQVFIGVYQNDLDTWREARLLQKSFPNVRIAKVGANGPTNKADCLNWIVKEIEAYESCTGTRFSAFVMQDAEDIVHPLSLKLFNFLVPRFDLVQLPVIPLERTWKDITGGHYMDEFAEFHSKEIIVREMFAGIVPGAGVGTAYSRAAFDFARKEHGETFNTSTLTEDYEFSFRLRSAGLKQIFVRLPFQRSIERRNPLTRRTRLVTRTDYICTREYFPNTFSTAVRQKTRWTIGIALQSWKFFGWQARWQVRYLFFRDRKMVIMGQFVPLGLLVLFTYSALFLWSLLDPSKSEPTLLPPGSPFWPLVYVNFGFLIWRMAQRHYWTHKYYGLNALVMVIPRYFWAMIINYSAVVRAIGIYFHSLRTGEPIGWDKTAHEYPDEEQLSVFRRRLGDILIERGHIDHTQLEASLTRQRNTGGPLGSCLLEGGYVNSEDLLEALGEQLNIAIWRHEDEYASGAGLMDCIPPALAHECQVVPLRVLATGALAVGVDRRPRASATAKLEAVLKRPVSYFLITDESFERRMLSVQSHGLATQAPREVLQ